MAKRRKDKNTTSRVVFAILLTIVLVAAFFYYTGQAPAEGEQAAAPTQTQEQTARSTPAASPDATDLATPSDAPEQSGEIPAKLLPKKGQLSVIMIDVGQGDSIFIQSPSGKTMLIDAGEQEAYPAIDRYLDAAGVDTIDVLVATHPHSDHIGGMEDVVKGRTIGAVYMPKVASNSKTYEDLLRAISAKKLKIKTAAGGKDALLPFDDALSVRILSPLGKTYENLNNYSVVLRIAYGSRAVLLTGDAEKLVEDEMREAFAQDLLQADVLKVGHHGSTTSTSAKFLTAVSPQIALISCGKGNDYGHPHKEILDRLKKAGAQTYRTDKASIIAVFTDGKSISVATLR